VKAEVVEPDPATLIVRLPGARIASDAERRVDTREFGGPVEIFSVFQTPDVKVPEVRVVLKRNAPVPAELAWDGNQLRVQLARSADSAAAPAAASAEHAESAAAAPASDAAESPAPAEGASETAEAPAPAKHSAPVPHAAPAPAEKGAAPAGP